MTRISVRRTVAALAALNTTVVAAQTVIHVNAGAPLGGDGLTWQTAFADLNDALGVPDVAEIWVAAGVYSPDRGTGDRAAAFMLGSNLAVYGGFVGNEADRSQRDPAVHPTILSGDLKHDDGPEWTNRQDNSTHVVRSAGHLVELDGLTIQGGNATADDESGGLGGGLLFDGGNLHLMNCRVVDNMSAAAGGGLFVRGTWITLERCLFEVNRVAGDVPEGFGGAVAMIAEYPRVLSCEFRANAVQTPRRAFGGALHLAGVSALIGNTIFHDNSARASEYAAGGAASSDECIIEAFNCVFVRNTATADTTAVGGAASLTKAWMSRLSSSTLLDNSVAAASGDARIGGIAVESPDFVLANSILRGNSDASGSGETAQVGVLDPGQPLDVEYCLVGGWTGALGGAGNFDADPHFTDPLGADGAPSTGDENLVPGPFSPCIDSGSRAFVPLDLFDLDHDEKWPELLSLDLADHPRLMDDHSVADTGFGYSPVVDIGALERQAPSCLADCDISTGLGVLDIFDYLCFFGQINAHNPAADCTGDNAFDLFDFLCFTNAFNAGC